MYGKLRKFIFLILVIIGIGIIKKFFGNKKKLYIIMSIILAVLWMASAFVPLENLFITFDSPESVYTYVLSGKAIKTVEGTESALVVGKDKNTTEMLIIPKAEKGGWKIGRTIDTKNLLRKMIDDALFWVYRYKDTSECYIMIFCPKTEPFNISDSKNSEFVFTEETFEAIDTTYISCYAYIPGLSKEYSVTINGNRIDLSGLLS